MAKKNLIYVFADQWRASAVGHLNKEKVITPNIDKLFEKSCYFKNAVSTFPVCSPHRAALLTGRYPYQCRMFTNAKTGLERQAELSPKETLISDVLYKEGYQTAYIGKWHLDAPDIEYKAYPEAEAQKWDAFTPPGERRHHFEFWYAYNAMDNHIRPHYYRDEPKKIYIDKWSPEHETDVALEYLANRNKDKPFCLFMSINPPHPPADKVPSKYLEMYEDCEIIKKANVPAELYDDPKYIKKVKQYYAAVTGVDEQIGRLMTYLDENNLWSETLFVLSADHGDYLGSHGKYGKSIWHEESIQIPLYFAGAGVQPNVCDSVVGSVDHMPTILEYLNIKIPETVVGESVSNNLNGDMQNIKDEAFLCMCVGLPEEHLAYHKLGLDPDCFGWRGIRFQNTTYVVNNGWNPNFDQQKFVLDLVNDPDQLRPKYLSDQEVGELDLKLKKYLDVSKDPFLLKRL